MGHVTVAISGDLARVTIDNPPVNALGQAVRQGLLQAMADLAGKTDVRAVVLCCAGRSFVAGADIREFGKPPAEPYLPDVLAAIEAAAMPWVAAIHGNALGGGLELAMACHGRVAEAAAKLGLPEVTLGIIPGSGGTVRLPRLVPMAEAIALVTGGTPIAAVEAQRIGLIDRLAKGDLLAEAETLARDLAAQGTPRPTLLRDLVPGAPIDWVGQESVLRQHSRGAAAPLEALQALRHATKVPASEALAAERERFLRLAASPEAAALRYIFFAERAAGKGLRDGGVDPVDLSRVGVIGGGPSGAGIATALLLSGSQVHLIERDADAATAARGRVADTIAGSVQRGAIPQIKADAALARLDTGDNYAALAACPLVIEAELEDLALKRQILDRLDAVMAAEAILATNISYLDVNALAAPTRDPSRILGLHFLSPAHVVKLLEVVRGDRTSARALAAGAALARRLGKVAVLTGVCDGFIGNRIMAACRRDCEFVIEEGALPQQIDAAMEGFGFAMGIYAAQDLSGLDVAWARRKAMATTRPPGERHAHIADRLCEAGRLGRKTGKGWYDYTSGSARPDLEVEQIIADERAKAGRTPRIFSGDEIMARILRIMQSEGQALLDEGIAESASDIDVVVVNGYGFPRHRGGPMFMAGAAAPG